MNRKRDKTGRSKKEACRVRLYHSMLESEAWRSLDTVARAVYVELAQRYNGETNCKLNHPVREGTVLGTDKSTVARTLDKLKERGFIEVSTKGAFSRKVRHATDWRLTQLNCDATGELASHA